MSIISDLIFVGASLAGLATDFFTTFFPSCALDETQKISSKKNFRKMKNLNMKFNFGRFVFFIFISLIAGIIIFNTPKSLDAEELKRFNQDPKSYNVKLQIFNQDNSQIAEFMTAIADDDYKKMYGLMFVKDLPENFAMLFNFNHNIIATMWMKNTLIPLDMLFIDGDGIIVNIKHNAEPRSLEVISSEKHVQQVLEINGGICQKLGIEIGDKIRLLK